MTCAVEKRDRVRDAASAIASHPKCAGVDVLGPSEGTHETWALEATLTSNACPPGVLRALAGYRLRIQQACPRGTGFHVVATT